MSYRSDSDKSEIAELDIFDYYQNVARAGFGDMLHDSERNQKYYLGIKEAIEDLRARGLPVNVLDIGTGTGLLSMMAVKCGADSVTACEAFAPMAECASKIIEKNGMADKIKLIRKRSTEIIVGRGGDMVKRANLLVTEVFDTELIGEGAIGIFNHAHELLLENDCLVVPKSGTIFVQLVESSIAQAWNTPKSIADLDGKILVDIPKTIQQCAGAIAVHDIQLSQLTESKFKKLTKPQAVLEFDFSGKTLLDQYRVSDTNFEVEKSGNAQMVFMWWDLKMNPNENVILSCAPYWAHPDFEVLRKSLNDKIPIQNAIPWRDHWMQAIYYLPKSEIVNVNDSITIRSSHDEYSLWFELIKDHENINNTPSCECLFHLAYSRTRIAQLSESLRNKKYLKFLEKTIKSNSKVLVLSEGSLLGLSVSGFGAETVYILEPNKISNRLMQSFVEHNRLKNVSIIESFSEVLELTEITHVFGEPYYTASISAFDNLYYHKLINEIKDKLREDVIIAPKSAEIFSMPVEFLDLHKIAIPVKECETFDMKIYDDLLSEASNIVDNVVESQPLWEYPCYAANDPDLLASINFSENKIMNEFIHVPIQNSNGVVFWIDWILDDALTISTGPTAKIQISELVPWNMYCQQSVHIFRSPFPTNNPISFIFSYENGKAIFKLKN